jgi:hypothetical protein
MSLNFNGSAIGLVEILWFYHSEIKLTKAKILKILRIFSNKTHYLRMAS